MVPVGAIPAEHSPEDSMSIFAVLNVRPALEAISGNLAMASGFFSVPAHEKAHTAAGKNRFRHMERAQILLCGFFSLSVQNS